MSECFVATWTSRARGDWKNFKPWEHVGQGIALLKQVGVWEMWRLKALGSGKGRPHPGHETDSGGRWVLIMCRCRIPGSMNFCGQWGHWWAGWSVFCCWRRRQTAVCFMYVLTVAQRRGQWGQGKEEKLYFLASQVSGGTTFRAERVDVVPKSWQLRFACQVAKSAQVQDGVAGGRWG